MLKKFKGLTKAARRDLGDENDRERSSGSPSVVLSLSPTINSTISSPVVPVVANTTHQPETTPLKSGNHRDKGWEQLNTLVKVLATGAGAFTPVRLVMEDLAAWINIHEDFITAQQDYAALRIDLEGLFRIMSIHFSGNLPPTMTTSIINLCAAINAELSIISDKEGRGTGRRYWEARQDLDDIMECYRRIYAHVQRLTLNADLSVWKIVDEQATETRLKSLTPSMSACYDSAEAALVRRRECTPNTRQQVLADLSHWSHDPSQSNLYWMNGMAGTGKTTIANSLCAMLDRSHELGASFFCSRQLPECRSVHLILPTIAYQLARYSRPFRCSLSRSLERDPDLHTKALVKQFEGLVAGPLQEVANALPIYLVVVIDALDECDDPMGVGTLLEMFAKRIAGLPVKVFVSSRPEPQIRQRIGSAKSQLILHELDKSIVKEDIETYLRAEFERMSLSDIQLASLIERAGVLFIYAATVVRYVGEEDFSLNPKKRLENVLGASSLGHSNKDQEIDELYALVLASALDNPKLELADREVMRVVLHTVICAQEPLSANDLVRLLELDDVDQVHAALRPLWSVLNVSKTTGLISVLHASFPDYIFDLNRSKQYWCNHGQHHGRMMELCFRRIARNEPQFNICGLQSSYLLDAQVPDLEDRVARVTPPELLYACQYWAAHLELAEQATNHKQILEDFMSKQLLLWIEVLNLTKTIRYAVSVLDRIRSWCAKSACSEALTELVHDAWRFTTVFATNRVCHSTPHLYVSMLASWPSSNPIAAHYSPGSQSLVRFQGPGMARRQLAQLGTYAMSGPVSAVAFSPKGSYLGCGCGDSSVYIWDVQTGRVALGPLKGHNNEIVSVGFSPDGTRLASGSTDGRICVWDAYNGEMLLEPLETGDWAFSIAFSPCGTYVASGATNGTVNIWDLRTASRTLGPLHGHTDWIDSVAFSPDGQCIASGASDATILIWGTEDGRVRFGPLRGHAKAVVSVSFSPDGRLLASGSKDCSICIWDMQTGQMTLGPLEQHVGAILSVSFSPDGRRIVSGSGDKTICIWNAESGTIVLGPLEGHLDLIHSVGFSPDGTRIASGAKDSTICVWDAQSKGQTLAPTQCHTELIWSVAVSPNGRYTASGSADTKICVWDNSNQRMDPRVLEGRAGGVYSVVFSPDSLRLASGHDDGTVRLWDVESGKPIMGPLTAPQGASWSIAFSPDGVRIAAGSTNGSICVWNLESGDVNMSSLEERLGAVYSIMFSPDGTRIASGSRDGTVRLWSSQTVVQLLDTLQDHTKEVRSVAFSPRGDLIASSSADCTIRLWDAQSGQLVLRPFTRHSDAVTSIAFFPKGDYLASGSDDKSIIIWDVHTGNVVLGPLMGHVSKVTLLAFFPNGTRIVSGSVDQSLRVWKVPYLKPKVPSHETVTPTSRRFGSGAEFAPSGITYDEPLAWVPDGTGWILDTDGRLLVWVPSDLRRCLLAPRNISLMSRYGWVTLEFEGAKIGECWTDVITTNKSPSL